MPASESLGSLEQLILTAVDALKDKAYGAQVYDLACEFAGKELNAGSIYVTLERWNMSRISRSIRPAARS
jgi:hypothetical protein